MTIVFNGIFSEIIVIAVKSTVFIFTDIEDPHSVFDVNDLFIDLLKAIPIVTQVFDIIFRN